jgi:nucleoside-diphosphate-sugar epimerase
MDLTRDVGALAKAVRGFAPDAVINCAGTTCADPKSCINAHILITSNLLRIVGNEAPGARFVQVGSAAEYGQPVAAPQMIDEDSPPNPLTPYGISKLASTLLTIEQGAELGLDCIVLRVFNLIGPDMNPGTIVPRVMNFLTGDATRPSDPIHLGRLDLYRDFVHINDVVAAIVRAATTRSPNATARIVNIASGEIILVRDLVRGLLDAAGHSGEIVEDAVGGSRSVGVTWLHTSIIRAREVLDWQPQIGLTQAMAELVKIK